MKRIKQAEKQAQEGKLDDALLMFKEARKLDAHFVTFDIKARAKQLFAQGVILEQSVVTESVIMGVLEPVLYEPVITAYINPDSTRGWSTDAPHAEAPVTEPVTALSHVEEVNQAIAKYQEAQQISSLDAWDWNILCWNGSLYGHAAKVMDACETAVTLVHEYGRHYSYRNRGLARALIGNTQGAIEDFQFAIEQSDEEEYQSEVQGWLDAILQSENPFTPEVLKELLKENNYY